MLFRIIYFEIIPLQAVQIKFLNTNFQSHTARTLLTMIIMYIESKRFWDNTNIDQT